MTQEQKLQKETVVLKRQPAIFVNHGAGPDPYLQSIGSSVRFGDQSFIIESCRSLAQYIQIYQPKAILVVSAHWEETSPTVIYQAAPPLLYDYYNWSKDAYELKYPAKCDLKLTEKVIHLFETAGVKEMKRNTERGWDHGVFIPLLMALPKADIPLLQLSLYGMREKKNADDLMAAARENLRMGAILSSLRDEGVMIVGSGASFHGYSTNESKPKSDAFNQWLIQALTHYTAQQSIHKMLHWFKAPNALFCHPFGKEEHLLPLHVCVGSNIDVKTMDHWLSMEKQDDIHDKEQQQKQIEVKVFTEYSQKHINFCGFVML